MSTDSKMHYLTDKPPGALNNDGCVYMLFGGMLILIAAASIDWLLSNLPLLLFSTQSRLMCVATVLVLGLIFQLLKKKQLFLYACLEVGAAAGAAFDASSGLAKDHETRHGVLALLGALYIAVRAYDNFSKWRTEKTEEQKKKTLAAILENIRGSHNGKPYSKTDLARDLEKAL